MTDDWDDRMLIRTCFVIEPDGDQVAAFAIDGRRHPSAAEFRRVHEQAWDEMTRRRVGCEWEAVPVGPADPAPSQPSWEEYRADLDARHPLPAVECTISDCLSL